MKDLLIGIFITITLSVMVSIFGEVEEPPKRKQGNVQVPTLVEINPENTEVDTDTETVKLSPQTGGFWVEKVI